MELAESVKNLSVILDADNSMQRHEANLCETCYYHLRELQRVRSYLNHEIAVKVANALVSNCMITVIYCLLHKEGICCQTTKSSKCLMSYCVQTI